LDSLESSDCILLVGVDLKQELPLLNARLRSSFLRDNSSISSIGANSDSGFPTPSLGLGIDELESFIEGRHPLCSLFAQADNPKLVISSKLFDGSNGAILSSMLDMLSKTAPKNISKGVSILNLNASSVGSCELGQSVRSVSKDSK